MKRRAKMMVLILRGCGIVVFIPTVVVLMVAPLMALRLIALYDSPEFAYNSMYSTVQYLIPVFSVWWPFLFLREYVEGEGREVLCHYGTEVRTIVAMVFLSWSLFAAHIGITCAILNVFYEDIGILFLRLLAQSAFFSGLYVWMIFLEKSSGISLLTVVVYYFVTAFLVGDSSLLYISVFQVSGQELDNGLMNYPLLIALAGLIFYVCSFVTWKKTNIFI